MKIGIISEIVSSGGKFCMLPSAFIEYRSLILNNIDGRVHSNFSGGDSKYLCKPAFTSGEQGGRDLLIPRNSIERAVRDFGEELSEDDHFVNVISITGPISRRGEECTVPSTEVRDLIVELAKLKQCRGHILVTDTPGGWSSVVQDLRFAVNFAHRHGQKVFMLIDGMAASAGAFIAAICDKVYYTNPEDEIGSLGMYSAFFTLGDGATNAITSEVYHEYYASKSSDKNAGIRAAAEGDMALVKESTDKALSEMIANIRKDRPSISEDQLTGAMYKVKDVHGTLVDGKSDVVSMAKELDEDWTSRSGAAIPEKEVAEREKSKDSEDVHEDSSEDNAKEKCNPADKESKSFVENKTPNDMKKQFLAIPSAIGEEMMESLDGSLNLQPEEAEALEEHVKEMSSKCETLQQSVAEQAEKLTDSTSKIEALKKALDEMTTARDEVQALLSAAISEKETAESEAKSQIEALTEQLSASKQAENDLLATVDELRSAQGRQPDAGAAPESDGSTTNTTYRVVAGSYDPNASAEENARRHNENMDKIRKMANGF